jgi:hypothetical protein
MGVVMIGFLLSIFNKYIFEKLDEKKQNREYLIINIEKISNYIQIVKNTIMSFINFIEINIINLEEYEIEELIENLFHFTKKSFLLWPEFRTILYLHFKKTIKNKQFEHFKKFMDNISFQYYGTKLDKFVKPDKDMILARQESMLKNKGEYLLASKIIYFLETEFISILGKK